MKRMAIAAMIMMMLAAAPGAGDKTIDQMTTKELRDLARVQQMRIAELERQRDMLEAQITKLGAKPATAASQPANPITITWVHEADQSNNQFILMQLKVRNDGKRYIESASFIIECIDADGDVIDRSKMMMDEDKIRYVPMEVHSLNPATFVLIWNPIESNRYAQVKEIRVTMGKIVYGR